MHISTNKCDIVRQSFFFFFSSPNQLLKCFENHSGKMVVHSELRLSETDTGQHKEQGESRGQEGWTVLFANILFYLK